jgi:sigma-E factor negative regulatory protein RseA
VTVQHPLPNDEAKRVMSDLADGQPGAALLASRLWREDPEARQAWHTYQLIGDVMRSDELARPAAHDAAFLARLRQRLASEPVLLAPVAAEPPAASAATSTHDTRGTRPAPLRWLMPVAAAAGVAVVAGVLVLTRAGGEATGPAVASSVAGPGISLVSSGGMNGGMNGSINSGVSSGVSVGANGSEDSQVLRDPRLDEYLRAHQFARGGMGGAAPGGSLRRVEAAVPAAQLTPAGGTP